ncbi:hypothetical protein FSC37_02805 [Piscinibacter aquaticus]|uniref:Uncharacterized protein n=1 Tax=Piscinibacter aquaticus TaxID=392597 RepID=A0A5C6U143_9BURK|nr:hypothetical protein FSC37_02805 [Piscinibacter aquaticus]
MRDEVEGLIQTELDPTRINQTGLFDRIAGNLGALGFLIDMLSVQPQMAKSLFVFDPRTGTLDPVMGRGDSTRHGGSVPPVEPRLIEQAQQLAFAAAQPDVPVAEVARDLERLSHEAHRPIRTRWPRPSIARARRWPAPSRPTTVKAWPRCAVS